MRQPFSFSSNSCMKVVISTWIHAEEDTHTNARPQKRNQLDSLTILFSSRLLAWICCIFTCQHLWQCYTTNRSQRGSQVGQGRPPVRRSWPPNQWGSLRSPAAHTHTASPGPVLYGKIQTFVDDSEQFHFQAHAFKLTIKSKIISKAAQSKGKSSKKPHNLFLINVGPVIIVALACRLTVCKPRENPMF